MAKPSTPPGTGFDARPLVRALSVRARAEGATGSLSNAIFELIEAIRAGTAPGGPEGAKLTPAEWAEIGKRIGALGLTALLIFLPKK